MYHIPKIGKSFTFTNENGTISNQTVAAVVGNVVTLIGPADTSHLDYDTVMNGSYHRSCNVERRVRLNMNGEVEEVA
jgi:hypothetical protein